MAIEAPYKGRDPVPAKADKVEAVATDKPEAEVETSTQIAEADKRKAPQPDDEPEVPEEEVEEPEQEPEEEVDTDLILMRADYTKKVMALAEEKKATARREAELAQRYGVYEQVDAMLASNPDLAKTHTIEQLVAIVQSPEAPARSTALPPEIRREIDAMRREVADTKRSLFDDRAESAVKRVQRTYGLNTEQTRKLVETAVAEELLSEEIPMDKIHRRLDILARAMNYKKAEAKGQAKLVKTLKDKARAASAGTSSAPTESVTTQPTKHKGWAGLIAKHQRGIASGG